MSGTMTRFEYGTAEYRDQGSIEAHPECMRDVMEGTSSLGSFLYEAGQKGWELCALLPARDSDHYTAVFKRPVDELRAP